MTPYFALSKSSGITSGVDFFNEHHYCLQTTKEVKVMSRYRLKRQKLLSIAAVTLIIMAGHFLRCPEASGTLADKMAGCAAIEQDALRLRCYDEAAGRKTGDSSVKGPVATEDTGGGLAAAETPAEGDVQNTPALSFLTRHWDLDKKNRKRTFAIRPYRPNYFLPLAYNTAHKGERGLDVDPKARAQNTGAKFQISFKVKLWEDIAGKEMDLWFAYTQLALWQLYNAKFSAPFRETNYEPELLLNFRTDYEIIGLKGRMISVGLNHQSNGRAEPLSRSWNRVVANFGFERGDMSLLLRTWYRIPENTRDDDNPDIDKYLGYGEIWGHYFWKRNRFSVMLRNNLRPSANKGAFQFEWSFPLIEHVSGYVQYFNGYGENLLDYKKNVNRVGIGFVMTDW